MQALSSHRQSLTELYILSDRMVGPVLIRDIMGIVSSFNLVRVQLYLSIKSGKGLVPQLPSKDASTVKICDIDIRFSKKLYGKGGNRKWGISKNVGLDWDLTPRPSFRPKEQ